MKKRKKETKTEKVALAAADSKVCGNEKKRFPFSSKEKLLVLIASILGINLFWFITGGAPLYEESAFRFVAGSIFIFLLPGMIWGELLGFKSDQFYITIAKSFLLSLSVAILFIPIPFFFTATIKLWVWLMLAITFAGIVLLFYRLKLNKNERFGFLSPVTDIFEKPFRENSLLFIQIIFIALISFGAYRWGEDIGSVSGEKLLHMTFLRYYFSMPMDLYDLSLTRGVPPPNLVNLWEYLLAGWSTLINIDPLYLFYRCRFVIPLLGLSGMYLLVSNIFIERRRAEAVFSGVLLMSLGAFVLFSPSPYDWLKAEQFRGVFSFMGTAHHADAASDILVALGAGAVFLAAKETSWRNLFLLSSALIASFLWHPREFFQNAVYAGMLGLTTLLIPSEERLKKLKKWLVIVAVFFVIAILFFILMKLLIPPQSHGYDEFKIKEIALKYAFHFEHITGIRNLFRFPSMFTISSTFEPDVFLSSHSMYERALRDWNHMPVFLLTALAIPLLFLYGDRRSKILAMFTFLLWFLALSWNFSMLILIALTYSEIHMSTARILYLFSYIVIADAFYILSTSFYKPEEGLSKNLVYPGAMFLSGIALMAWWHFKAPLVYFLTYPITAIAWLSAIAAIFNLSIRNKEMPYCNIKAGVFAVIGMAAFFTPVLAKDYLKLGKDIISGSRQTIEWHGENNPFELSPALLSFLKFIEPKKNFVMDLNGKACIFVYHPQYAAIVPKVIGTIISAYEEQDIASFGLSPLFNSQTVYGIRRLASKEIKDLNPFIEDNFSNWRGPGTVHWTELSKVTAPFMVLSKSDGTPNFMISRVFDGKGALIRLIYEKEKTTVFNRELIMLGYYFKRISEEQKADFITFSVSARADTNLSKPARLLVFDEVPFRGFSDKEPAAIEIKGVEWRDYTVTKRIRKESIALGAAVHWTITDKAGWVEIRDPKVYIYDSSSLTGQRLTTAGIDEIVDRKAVMSWLDRHRADYVLVNKNHYTVLKRFFSAYPDDFEVAYDDPVRMDIVAKYKSSGRGN